MFLLPSDWSSLFLKRVLQIPCATDRALSGQSPRSESTIQSLSSLIPIGNQVIGSANEDRIIRQVEQLGLLDNFGRTTFKFSSSLLDTTILFVTCPAQSLFFLNVLFLAALEPGHFDCQAKHFFAKPLAKVTLQRSQ